MRVTTWIAAKVASIGQNVQFIAFWAHAGVAALAIEHCGRFKILAAFALGLVAAVKEFVFDVRFEQSPPQTLTDGIEDFVGWFVGAVAGIYL